MDEQYEQREDFNSGEYEEPQQERVSEGEPIPADFVDYDEFVKAQIDFRVKKASEGMADQQIRANPQTLVEVAVRKGLTDAMDERDAREAQRQSQLNAILPDDEMREDKKRLLEDMEKFAFNESEAKQRGDKEAERMWHYHAMATLKEIKALPPSKAEQMMEEANDEFHRNAAKLLTDPNWLGRPEWTTSKWQHDASKK